ncbi:MAG: NAD-dependent epimerase/dehydratase family protein [Candidatus Omnitrophica bacterium]|nr:NAD-dependent epimerase/dehydratase family protein [Candidatus Omnitrophota bacterium]
MKKYLIVGGAGFIGSHLVKILLKEENDACVVVYDNFSSGRKWHLEEVTGNRNLKIVKADVKDIKTLKSTMKGIDIVYHLASNPDISRAITKPDIDFWEGTYLTHNVLEAMRINNVKKILYASGSGVYGDAGSEEVNEDYPFKLPISTYGASKLASEALISAYCYMFDMQGVCFRLANVVGPGQTHGVGYDFVRKLLKNPKELVILGDGRQSKSYIYITDVIQAMRLLEKKTPSGFSYYNVSSLDYLEVREIADMVVEIMGLKKVRYRYTGGDRGWKGDVPVVRMNSEKIRRLSWSNKYNSRTAMRMSIKHILQEVGRR